MYKRQTIKAPKGISGTGLAEKFKENYVECEFADEDYIVLMATPENSVKDFDRLVLALGENTFLQDAAGFEPKEIPLAGKAKQTMSMRDAYFSEGEMLHVHAAVGRICRMPMASCPPAIPVVVPGERIDEAAVQSFLYYGITTVDVVKE